MKLFFSIALALVCAGLTIALIKTKQDDNARHEMDVSTITDYSKQLDGARSKIVAHQDTILTLSNSLAECEAASLALSNRVAEAQAAIVLDTEQITNLNRRVAEMALEQQAASRRILDLTNQVAGLTTKVALTETNLAQANKEYALLENRLRRDVAERIVVERKFNNLPELQAQIKKLADNPAQQISAEGIYAGLGIEVRADGTFRVISMD
jgi:chromosome segregation ATPase